MVRVPTGDSARIGGVISYKGSFLVHTVDHFLRPAQPTERKSQEREDMQSSDVECEIMGLSDSEDEDYEDIADVTSRASQTPNNSDYEDSDSDTSDPSQRSRVSGASFGVTNDRGSESSTSLLPGPRLSDAFTLGPPSPSATRAEWGSQTRVGEIVATSKYLDSSFVRVSAIGHRLFSYHST